MEDDLAAFFGLDDDPPAVVPPVVVDPAVALDLEQAFGIDDNGVLPSADDNLENFFGLNGLDGDVPKQKMLHGMTHRSPAFGQRAANIRWENSRMATPLEKTRCIMRRMG